MTGNEIPLDNSLILDGTVVGHVEKELVKRFHKLAKRLTGHSDQNGYIVNHGATGCIAGDTTIKINRGDIWKDYPIKKLYNRLNGNPDKVKGMNNKWDLDVATKIYSFNGYRILTHKIKRVLYSGKKIVWKLQLEDGKEIKATPDHKFLTANGWKELQQLNTEDKVMCRRPKLSNFDVSQFEYIKIKNIIQQDTVEDTYDIECEEPYHNFAANEIIVHNSGKTNTSIIEAHYMNSLMPKRDQTIYLFFRLDDMIEFAKKNTEKTIIWDEPAFTSISTDHATTLNKDLFRYVNTSRLLRHLTIINFTKFWRFNVDLITETAQFMIHMNEREAKKGRFVYIPQSNLDSLWDDYKKFGQKNYSKYKTFGGSFPKFYKENFSKLNICVDGKMNATYDDYLILRNEAVMKIGGIRKLTPKEKRAGELKQKIAKAIERINKMYGIPKMDLYPVFEIDSKTVDTWAKSDLVALADEDLRASSGGFKEYNGVKTQEKPETSGEPSQNIPIDIK